MRDARHVAGLVLLLGATGAGAEEPPARSLKKADVVRILQAAGPKKLECRSFKTAAALARGIVQNHQLAEPGACEPQQAEAEGPWRCSFVLKDTRSYGQGGKTIWSLGFTLDFKLDKAQPKTLRDVSCEVIAG